MAVTTPYARRRVCSSGKRIPGRITREAQRAQRLCVLSVSVVKQQTARTRTTKGSARSIGVVLGAITNAAAAAITANSRLSRNLITSRGANPVGVESLDRLRRQVRGVDVPRV